MSDNLLIELAAVLASERKSIPVSNLADRWLLDEKYQSAQAERRSTERKFNPDQPRIPGGHEGGGRWGSFGAGLKLHSLDDLIRIYGDWADEVGAVEFEDGSSQFAIVRFDGGDMALLLNNAGPNREYAILTDGGADDMRELADRLEWAATGGDHNAGAPDPDNHLVDWDWVNDSILVGYDESGDVRIGFPSDEDPDELVEFDLSGEDAGEAWEVIDALRDMADAQDAAVETVDGQRSEHRSVLPSSVPTKPGKRARRRMPRKVPRSLYRKKKQPAAMRKFDPNQPRIPGGHQGGGRWGAVGALIDRLKLLGRIDLDRDESLLASGKLDVDSSGARFALTRIGDGSLSWRLGFGSEGYGQRDRDSGVLAWDGNGTPPALDPADRARLEAERETLDDEYDDATPARQAEIDARLQAIHDELITGEGEFNGTAKVDQYGVDRLVTATEAAMAEAVAEDKSVSNAFDELDALNYDYKTGQFPADVDPARVAALVARAHIDPNDPAYGGITFTEGIIPGTAWGDIHYTVELDEPSSAYDGAGPFVTVGVWPKGAPEEWGQARDWRGQFTVAEWRKFLRQIEAMRAAMKQRFTD